MTIQEELSLPEYENLSNPERLALLKSKTTRVVGRIEQGKLKVLEAIIANGLWRDKMEDMKVTAKSLLADENATTEQKTLASLKMKIVAGFHEAISEAKMANKASFEMGGHTINMSDVTVSQTFNAAVSVGLITSQEATQVLELSKYDKQSYPDATILEVINHFNPELISIVDSWYETEVTDSKVLNVRLLSTAPSNTYIVFQMKDIRSDNSESDWYHATALHGVFTARDYKVEVPYNGHGRKFRWKCEYIIDCIVSI